MKSYNGIGDSGTGQWNRFPKPQDYDDKDSEQLSSFISQGKNTMYWLILSQFMFSCLTVALWMLVIQQVL